MDRHFVVFHAFNDHFKVRTLLAFNALYFNANIYLVGGFFRLGFPLEGKDTAEIFFVRLHLLLSLHLLQYLNRYFRDDLTNL